MQSRRSFLVTGLAGASFAVAGCNSGSDDESGNNNNNGDGDSGPREVSSIDRMYTVQEDAYKGREFEFPSEGRIEYSATVRTGPAVDFYVMEQSEVTYLANQERFQYIEKASQPDATGAEVTADLPSGNYSMVIDNTNAGEAQPPTNFDDDIAEVDFSMTLYDL